MILNRNDNENLLRLLKRAREINLKFNKKKLNLRRSEVKFMGHVLTSDGVKPDADKVKAVAEMPRPTTKQETLGLLGFVNYLAKFLPRLSEVAQPLRELTTKNTRFVWSSQHYKSFTEVKRLVSAHPTVARVLVEEFVAHFSIPREIHSDQEETLSPKFSKKCVTGNGQDQDHAPPPSVRRNG